MVKNRIKVHRVEVGITATTLAEKMPEGVDKVAMSYIERGHVLPTREGLEALCETFHCTPKDIYAPEDLDLSAVGRDPASAAPAFSESIAAKRPASEKRSETITDGGELPRWTEARREQQQIRVWFNSEEKAALFRAIKGLGYHSVAEWLREMYRATIHKYISLKLETEKLHEAVPPTTEIKLSEVIQS